VVNTMVEQFKKKDYFEATDVLNAGEEAWNLMRSHAKDQGFRIDPAYGNLNALSNHKEARAYIFILDSDGDFVCVKRPKSIPLGKLRKMSELSASMPYIKVRIKSDDTLALVIEELKQRGYTPSAKFESQIENRSRITGIVCMPTGKFDMVVSEEAFSLAHAEADQLVYDLVRTVKLENFHIKQIFIEVSGVKCEAKALKKFLEEQKQAHGEHGTCDSSCAM